ncbi:MAG: 3'-5' exonuclease, partial [Candidatus Ornithospirochaeta sp.]
QMRLLWMDWDEWKKHNDRKYLSDQHLSEAMAVASFIKNEILGKPEEWPVSDKKGGERAPEPGDIAILLRKGSNQGDFEKALRYYSIPFNVPDNKSLTMDAVLNDFYNVLQTLVYGLDDKLSFASFLRSPFVSLSESGIKRVLENIEDNGKMDDGLSDDDSNLLSEGLETLEGAENEARKGKITPILSYLWIDRGYRYFIEAKNENRAYSEHYDYIFSLASSFDRDKRSLVEFLDRIRPILGKESDLKDITVQAEEKCGVTIETIHKSKGLEYPIVFVSDTGGRKNRGDSIAVTPDSASVPTVPFCFISPEKIVNPWALFSKREENDLENAENKRLLYVAATRAEHHLVFSGSINGEAKAEDKKGSYKNLLHYILKGLRFQKEKEKDGTVSYSCSFPDYALHDDGNPRAPFSLTEYKPVYMSLFHNKDTGENSILDEDWYLEPKEAKATECPDKCGVTTFIEREDFSSEILPPDMYVEKKGGEGSILPRITIDDFLVEVDERLVAGETEEEKEQKRKELRAEKITLFGTLVHKTLQNKILGVKDDYTSFFSGERRQKEIISEALRLRDNFFSSSFYNEVVSKYTLVPERNFMVKDGKTIVEGIIDLYCEKDDEILIVDYKTDSLRLDGAHTNQLNY